MPGIGKRLAERLHRDLGIDTLEQLEIAAHDGRDGEQQCTVITSQRGPLTGKRIVRGRETECLKYYQQAENQTRRLKGGKYEAEFQITGD